MRTHDYLIEVPDDPGTRSFSHVMGKGKMDIFASARRRAVQSTSTDTSTCFVQHVDGSGNKCPFCPLTQMCVSELKNGISRVSLELARPIF